MNIDTNTVVSMTEAVQNFSGVAKLVDQYGSAVILKNDTPRYLIMEFQEADSLQIVSDQEITEISQKLIERNAEVYKELAK